MSTTPPDYGEPWSKKEHNWSDSSLYAHGGKKYLFTHSIDDGSTTEDNQQEREDEQSRLLNRIVACVNACAGIPDPEAAITAARDALNDLLVIARIKWGNLDPDANTVMEKAQNAINILPTKP